MKLKHTNEYEKLGIVISDRMQVRLSIGLNVKSIKLTGVEDFGKEHRVLKQPINSPITL